MTGVLQQAAVEGRVPFFVTEVSEDARERAARVLRSGWVTTGPEVVRFEQEFADHAGVEHAVAVASCTHAIEIALRGLGLERGAKILTSAMTFCGAVSAIEHAGLRPVLVDIDPDTLMPSVRTTAEAAERAGGADGMLVLHYAGQPAPVSDLAEAAGVPLDRVVEDAAHAMGTWIDGRPVGAGSRAACFSFYATKNLPIGEGGMITTNDADLADFARSVRLHGMSRDAWKRYAPGTSWRYTVEVEGLKANMTDLQAAIGLGQLRHLSAWQDRREGIARRYDELLRDLPGLRLPARPELPWRHAWSLYVVQVEPAFGMARDEIFAALSAVGIDCSVHFIPLHTFPVFRHLAPERPEEVLAETEGAFRRILSLPMYPGLSDADVDRVGGELRELAAASVAGPGLENRRLR